VLAALVVVFGGWLIWKKISDRLDANETDLRALKGRLQALEARSQPEIKQDPAPVVPTPAPATAPSAVPSAQPASHAPRQDLDPAGALLGRPQVDATPITKGTARTESLETTIGAKWLLYVGIIAVIIGASYFIKLAFDNHWINETARVVIGAVAGVGLAYAGMRFVRAGFSLYGQVISGGGIAIVYLSIYAAFNFYHLVSPPAAFALMCMATIGAAWLADRQRSQALALMAVGGGFATPFLVATGRDAEVALFTYDAILVAGTMILAHRREWPWLNLLSYAGAVLTISFWASTFYTPDKFLATEAFLTLFCGMFLYLVYESRASTEPVARQVRDILWSSPAVYYAASLAVLFDHGIALLIYLTLVHVIGVSSARQRHSSKLRLLSWIAALAPLAGWISEHANAGWFVPGLAVVAGVYAITLLAQLDVLIRDNRRLDDTDLGLVHANGLAAYGCAYMLIDAVHPFAAAPAAMVFAAWHLAAAALMARRNRNDALHFAGVAFTLTSIAIALRFNGAAAVVAWAAEGAAAVWLGLHEDRAWLRAGGAVLLAVSIGGLVVLQLEQPYLGQLVFINRRALAGAFVIGALYFVAALYRRSARESELGWRGGRGWAPRDVLLVTANALTLVVLTSEISAFWRLREPTGPSVELARNARLSRETMISIMWAAYATGLIVVGLRRNYAPIRYFAMIVFALTILKVFMIDMASLDRIYRVASVIGLGVLLLATSYLYQRTRERSS
jgi:uncharacterized membrane protein